MSNLKRYIHTPLLLIGIFAAVPLAYVIAQTINGVPNQTITGAISVTSVTASSLTSGDCVQASTNGLLSTTSAACGTDTGSLTGNNSGSGAASGSSYNGAGTTTWSYNTFGAGGLAATNTWSAGNVYSYSPGAASTYAHEFTGTVYAAGTGTTTFPLVGFIQGGTAPSTWSTAGTELGMNAASGFTGNFIDTHVNGGSNLFFVNYQGYLTAQEVTAANLTSGQCVQASTGGLLTTTGSACGSGGGTTTNALTLNNGGSGASSGSTFNGSAAVTLSYNTIGAAGLGAANAFTGANTESSTFTITSAGTLLVTPTTITAGATPALSGANGIQTVTLGQNETPTISGIAAGQYVTFQICQPSSGGPWTWTWPSAIHGGITIGTTASTCSVQTFVGISGSTLVATGPGAINVAP